MTTPVPPAMEAKDWSGEMRAVATRHDRDSFMRLYDHFMPRLCLYLRGLGASDSMAEDIAQESLLRLWQHAVGYDPARSAVSTWLFRIARNLRIDQARRESHRGIEADALLPDDLDSGEPGAEARADHAQLQRRIDALAPIQARVIRMSYFEARSHQDIATELGMPLGTVKSHIRRAFQRLQQDIGGGE